MKRLMLLLISTMLLVGVSFADERVKGYWRDSDGDGYKEKYVQPYTRTSPDNNPYNNYSTQGNINPYTGKEGTVNPYNDNINNNIFKGNKNWR